MSGDIETGQCDFCKETKSIVRTYIKPLRYTKPKNPEDWQKLYNQGDYFIVIRTCHDCGCPKIT